MISDDEISGSIDQSLNWRKKRVAAVVPQVARRGRKSSAPLGSPLKSGSVRFGSVRFGAGANQEQLIRLFCSL